MDPITVVSGILTALGIATTVGSVVYDAVKSSHASGASIEEQVNAGIAASGKKVSKSRVQEAIDEARGARQAEQMGSTVGAAVGSRLRRSRQAEQRLMARKQSRWLGGEGRLARYTGKGLNAAIMFAILAPMLGEMFGRREEAGGLPEEGMGGGGMGRGMGGEQDLLALLAGLQGMSDMSVREKLDLADLEGQAKGARLRSAFAQDYGATNNPPEGALRDIIRGQEELLGSISHNEPLSFAQALARHGLVRSAEFEDQTPSLVGLIR